MDNPLVENNITEDGLILNNENDILKQEELSSNCGSDNVTNFCQNDDKVPNTKCEGIASQKKIKLLKLLENESLKSGSDAKENLSDKNANSADENASLDNSKIQPSMESTEKQSSDKNSALETTQNSQEIIATSKNEFNENDKALTETSMKSEGSTEVKDNSKQTDTGNKLDEKKLLKATLPQMNNFMSNMDSSLKAHLQYKNEKIKYASKQAICEEKQVVDLSENVFYDEDTICGFGSFRPQWMQAWATAEAYVFLYSIIGILHGSYYSSLIGSLSTLENRFAFKSKISGVIMVVDEIIPSLFGLIIGYYAGKAHRPRMIAVGMFLSAGCCFATAFPYFIYGPVKHLTVLNIRNETGPEVCEENLSKDACGLDDRPPTLPAVLFLILGSFLKGFGNIAYYAIGLVYMDDNSKKKSTPMYLAIALALRLLGPLLGYLMSFVFLKMYENPFEDPGFGPDDPRWIGAWWLGFCVQGVLLLIFTIPIGLFPRRMPGQRKPVQAKEETLTEMFSGLRAACKRLAKNPVFIFLTLNTVLTIFGHFGHLIMLPKYMENQFRLSASDASLFSGVTSVSCVMLSTVLGGFLIWKFKPPAKMILGGMVVSEIILVFGFIVLTIPRCQEVEMSHYGRNDDGLILDSVCNDICNCSTTSFTPFCGPNGKTIYFSPCHAGCTEQLNTSMLPEKKKKFGNCSCVADAVGNAGSEIIEGFCADETCWNQAIVYIIILLVMLTVSNTLAVAHTIILLRSVHPNDKSFALGTFETFICLCAFIPGPVTYGALVDSSCLVWEKSCDQTGNCWFYDMNKYNYSLHVTSSVFCGLSTLCLITLYFLNSRIRNLYVDEEDEQNYVNVKLDTVSGSVTKL